MSDWRRINLTIGLLGMLAGGCGPESVRTPPASPLADDLASDCRFEVDGVDTTASSATFETESEHQVAVNFRLAHPDQHRDGVQCMVRIVGQNLQRGLITYGQFVASARPDRDSRVSISGQVPMPSRAGEYEMQALILEGKQRHMVGRLTLVVDEPE